MKPYPQEVQATTRCAKAISLLCILVLIAIWFLNRTRSENDLRYKARADWYEETGSMLGKIRAYRAKNTSFFANLTLYTLTDEYIFNKNDDDVEIFVFGHYWKMKTGGGSRSYNFPIIPRDNSLSIQSYSYGKNKRLFDELEDSAKVFGKKAAAIVAKTKNNKTRKHLLTEAVLASFKNSEARRFLTEEKVITRMSKIDGIEEWPVIVDWIVFFKWPPSREGLKDWARGSILYTERFSDPWYPNYEGDHIYSHLRGDSNLANAEAIIESYWLKAYTDLKQTPTTVAQVSFPAIGLSVSANDLLMLAGPVLIFFQVLFLILWERQNSTIQSIQESEKPFIFPAFACPSDPLQSPVPKGLSEWGQRIIWTLFLIMPTIILSFGILTGYDFYTLKINYSYFANTGRSWFELLSILRSSDFLSLFLDFLNLACLAVSLLVLTNITSPPTKIEKEKSSHAIRMAIVKIAKPLSVLLIVIICSIVWFVKLRELIPNIYTHVQNLFYFTILGLLWLVFFAIALKRGAKIVIVLSLIGIMLFLLIFF